MNNTKSENNVRYLRVWRFVEDLDNLKRMLRLDQGRQISRLLRECIRLRRNDIAHESLLLGEEAIKRLVYQLTYSKAHKPWKAFGRYVGIKFNEQSIANPDKPC